MAKTKIFQMKVDDSFAQAIELLRSKVKYGTQKATAKIIHDAIAMQLHDHIATDKSNEKEIKQLQYMLTKNEYYLR